MSVVEQHIYEDLLTAQEVIGSELIYQESGDDLIAVALNDDGDETARYRVGINLEKL